MSAFASRARPPTCSGGRPRCIAPNLATAYRESNRLAEAVRLLQEVSDRQAKVYGPDHPDVLGTQAALAQALQEAGRVAEAIRLLERVLQATTAKLGPDHP